MKFEEFSVRRDEFSVQIISSKSPRFFFRVTSPPEDGSSLTFSDFILAPEDTERAVAALFLLRRWFRGPGPGMRIQVLDICPPPLDRDRPDSEAVARRHGQIVEVLTAFAEANGFAVENASLESRGGKHDTVVVTK